MTSPEDLSAALEAILFSSHRPLKLRELQTATSADRLLLSARDTGGLFRDRKHCGLSLIPR